MCVYSALNVLFKVNLEQFVWLANRKVCLLINHVILTKWFYISIPRTQSIFALRIVSYEFDGAIFESEFQ